MRDYDPDPVLAVRAYLSDVEAELQIEAELGVDLAPLAPAAAGPQLPLRAWLERSEEVHRFLRHRAPLRS